MIFRIRRDAASSPRFLRIRLALLFLGVAVWFVGSRLGRQWITGTAIGILAAALLLGIVARYRRE